MPQCRSCGFKPKSKVDVDFAFIHHYTLRDGKPQEKPESIEFVIICKNCGTEIGRAVKHGEEAVRLWRKLSGVEGVEA